MPRTARASIGKMCYHVINVEGKALRAKLVERAEAWPWSSLAALKRSGEFGFLVPGPVRRPRNWVALVNQEQPQEQIEEIRISVNRERPLGDKKWTEQMAKKLGMQHTIRPRGRPRKGEK